MALALVVAGSVGAAACSSHRPRAHRRATPAPLPAADTAPAESSTDPVPLRIPDSAYLYPPNAIFVAPTGNDGGAGTINDPFATVGHAVAVAASGATIVLRAGVYREALGVVNKTITLQPYPHEQAWLSGSVVVRGWTRTGKAWAHTGWTARFCRRCFDRRAITHAFPNAGLPDMVFVDGRPLSQVTSVAAVGRGKFFVDYGAQTLYLGDDPSRAGTVVESAAQSQALKLNARAAGSIVRGVGFEEYASQWNAWPNPATVVVNGAANVAFQRDAFVHSASRGLTVYATGVAVTDSLFVDNGMVGIHGDHADHIDLERNVIARNNLEHFTSENSSVASSAGIKLTHTGYAIVRGNIVENNFANGIWLDISCYAADIVDNVSRRNDESGIDVEISGRTLVASNVLAANGNSGLKLAGATDVRVYNNTLADNATVQLVVLDDGRRNTDPTTVALRITWRPARNTLFNNIFSAPRAGSRGPIVLTEDTDHPVVDDASSMITGLDKNVYSRVGSIPRTLAVWIHPSPAPADVFSDLRRLRTATRYERSGIELTGRSATSLFRNAVRGDYTLDPASPAVASGVSLPNDVATAIGASAGVAVDRGALVTPGRSRAKGR